MLFKKKVLKDKNIIDVTVKQGFMTTLYICVFELYILLCLKEKSHGKKFC